MILKPSMTSYVKYDGNLFDKMYPLEIIIILWAALVQRNERKYLSWKHR